MNEYEAIRRGFITFPHHEALGGKERRKDRRISNFPPEAIGSGGAFLCCTPEWIPGGVFWKEFFSEVEFGRLWCYTQYIISSIVLRSKGNELIK